MKKIKILHASIKYKEDIYIGRDHGEAYLKLPKENIGKGIIQGFVTSENKFVGRVEASKIAYEAGQTMEDRKYLISEELWFFGDHSYNKKIGYYLEKKNG